MDVSSPRGIATRGLCTCSEITARRCSCERRTSPAPAASASWPRGGRTGTWSGSTGWGGRRRPLTRGTRPGTWSVRVVCRSRCWWKDSGTRRAGSDRVPRSRREGNGAMSVAVVAYGAVSALGRGAAAAASAGVVRGTRARRDHRKDEELRAGGFVKPFAARARLAADDPRDRATQLLAMSMADCAAELDVIMPAWRKKRIGLAIGTSSGGMRTAEQLFARFARGEPLDRDFAARAAYFGPLLDVVRDLGARACPRNARSLRVLVVVDCARPRSAVAHARGVRSRLRRGVRCGEPLRRVRVRIPPGDERARSPASFPARARWRWRSGRRRPSSPSRARTRRARTISPVRVRLRSFRRRRSHYGSGQDGRWARTRGARGARRCRKSHHRPRERPRDGDSVQRRSRVARDGRCARRGRGSAGRPRLQSADWAYPRCGGSDRVARLLRCDRTRCLPRHRGEESNRSRMLAARVLASSARREGRAPRSQAVLCVRGGRTSALVLSCEAPRFAAGVTARSAARRGPRAQRT